ncbi:MAG: ammonium transporter [Bifidobacteriaceae bacterium]|nr:ammonium transporter [Bifidobacteriaceae bacterium]
MDTGSTAWVLVSATLVLLMTVPGLACFYGGMVRGKSVLNMMMMSFGSAGLVGVLWVLFGYSMAFEGDAGGIVGDPFKDLGLAHIMGAAQTFHGVPQIVFCAFEATFAIITVAVVSGSVADRTKFGTWLVFAALWVTLSYIPLCHMVWGGGLLSAHGAVARALATPLDFAGGSVVEIDAGMAGLVLALVTGRRRGFGREPMRPHSLPFVMLGAGLLWIGWFGFNAGSAGGANAQAGLAWVTTFVAAAASVLGWLVTERVRDGKATSLGAASGLVAGLVAITPAAGYVSPLGAILIGLVAGAVCSVAVGVKYRLGFDDSLDVAGVHLVGGLIGTLMVGLVGDPGAAAGGYLAGAKAGLLYGGGLTQLGTQALLAVVAVIFAGVVTAVLGLVLRRTMGWRIEESDEISGIDLAVHGETAYETVGTGRRR